ncbi:RtcB family protein [Ferruginibacter paludis]|uniref:RtcB family protein n=1 Tax=Ferruginibacter paludis TaxID=1310417 RepID=UPI0025B426C8|nr:RtcB family protein [Ferruginibacter paludis]MDN3658376.1 RtcB family protein [Ferruginibacter paludis]
MSKLKLTGKQIRAIGYEEGPVVSVAMHTMCTHLKHATEEEALTILKDILAAPENYLADEVLSKIAEKLMVVVEEEAIEIPLNENGVAYNVFGAKHIEEGALAQMRIAAKLPVAVAGALMPDAHQGYGLPIGGVLATDNVIIPYAVGVDIGCRMCLSIFAIDPEELKKREAYFQRELVAHTLFGAGREFSDSRDHEVIDRKEFSEIAFLNGLQHKALKQLGSSGSGNHFVEFGKVEISDAENPMGLAVGNYVGLLSHSGSRGMGASIANHYTQIAMEKTVLPKVAKHLAWLDLDSEEGMEYWLAMNLAGDYASACHHTIHEKIAKAIGEQALATVENHHNFAWKEMLEGKEVIVHRKGATPAGKDVLGIIPGSMTAPGFIVKGKGETASLNSASHGAGRKMSRSKALANITHEALKKELKEHGVKLIGGGLDEAPFAYKDINEVMQSQTTLVDVLGKFYPAIVQMDGNDPRKFRKRKDEIVGE